jgi:hypothetical protein
MESRIILSTADFSANNIGRYVILSDLTKKVLAKQTQYDEQSDEAFALDAFLKNLTDNGFIGGENPILKRLLIPCLASEYSELLYDIASLDGNGYPTNITPLAEQEATDKVFIPVLSGTKVIGLTTFREPGDTRTLAQCTLDSKMNLEPSAKLTSVSAFSYLLEDMNAAQNDIVIKIGSEYLNLTSNRGGIVRSSVLYGYTSGFGKKGFNAISYDNDNLTFNAIVETGTLVTSSETITSSLNGKNDENSSAQINEISYNETRRAKHAILGWGNKMTESQMSELQGYVNTFVTALGINI